MAWGSLSWEKIGGPCGVCGLGACALIATDLSTSAELGNWLAWYLLIAGIGYAGRLPIHVFGTEYVTRHPSLHKLPELRKKLNFLTCLNALSVVLWLLFAWFLLAHPTPDSTPVPLWAESAVGTAFYIFVMGLGMETVDTAGKLELMRGTEFVCKSRIGRNFKRLQKRAPEESAMHKGMAAVSKTTPPHQASWFLALVAAAILALPSGVGTAKTTEEVLDKQPPAEERRGTEETGEKGSQGVGETGDGVALDPTYEEECAGWPDPGQPAPSRQREQLQALWMGGGGIDGAGAIEAGCAERAKPAPGHPDVWTARGFCGSALRSLGISNPDSSYMPALLFQEAAEFALGKAREGKLRGASSRWPVGEGDLYVVDTDLGSYVLVREDASGGTTRPSGSLPCERHEEANVHYEVVPPGLIGLWLEAGDDGWVWPHVAAPGDPEAGIPAEFEFSDRDGEVVAEARCYSDLRCAAWIDEALHATPGTLFTSISVLEGMTG